MRKRRQFNANFKAEVVLAVLSGVKSQAEICREYQLTLQVFNRWKSQLLEHAPQLFQRDEQRSAEQQRIDITYVRLQRDFVYLAIVMDVFIRQIRGWHLSHSLDHTLTKTALERALRTVVHTFITRQGGQYATPHYTALLSGVQIRVAEVDQAWQNGYADRVIRTIKEDEIELSDYEDFADAWRQLGHFINTVYAHKRIHSALGYLTPAEFEAHWRSQQQHPDTA